MFQTFSYHNITDHPHLILTFVVNWEWVQGALFISPMEGLNFILAMCRTKTRAHVCVSERMGAFVVLVRETDTFVPVKKKNILYENEYCVYESSKPLVIEKNFVRKKCVINKKKQCCHTTFFSIGIKNWIKIVNF